ncbi:MAG: superoxide dismutase, Ni [Candidatus Doudnabacteria bacterium RIFCSPHIGHO2_01_FULL_49_9]|uniref:Superoxide dismutase, Ni n=1 Tax=Candidatus Doudnabacteria bacterium RIFCSPHIGHO2_01_FULL_49_9 TaxID=1817827 RepID=A0A1F5NYV4_9BACT|nr:MAG: superoxide dismutase, Ni [Candidatus Doudnabacteria bacterium RIFCSPHIGHO2_01_FULL_49_9]
MKILDIVAKLFAIDTAYAHCDIPCGIYSDHPSQMAADTVVKMVEKILALPAGGKPEEILQARNSFVRMVMAKEQHAELCKRELLILWTDYFKPEHLALHPSLHEQIWQAAKLCSKNKQEVNLEAAKELQQAVHEIGHIFGETRK